MTEDQSPLVPAAGETEVLTATLLGAVERQITRYFSAMSQQADSARQVAEDARDEMRAALAGQAPEFGRMIEQQRSDNDAYQQALRAALEERLTEFAGHQHGRMSDLETKMERVESDRSAVTADEIAVAHRALREDVDQAIDASTKAMLAELDIRMVENSNILASKLGAIDALITDRLLASEERINEQQGARIADLAASLGRVDAGFDEAIDAVGRRVLHLENRLVEVTGHLDRVTEQIVTFDQDLVDTLKEQVSGAVGEAMLVRIELDRVVASTDARFDKQALRISDVEATASDESDVSAAVQQERIEELERAIVALDPSQFVKRDEVAPAFTQQHGDSSTEPTFSAH